MIRIPLLKQTINSRRKKYTSIRTLRLFLYKHLLSKISFIRDRYAIYTSTTPPAQQGTVVVDRIFDESFSLSATEHDYLNSLTEAKKDLLFDSNLHLKKRCHATIVDNCSILGKVEYILHRPTKKLLTNLPLNRNMVKMFHYRSIKTINQLAIPCISTARGHTHYYHFILDRLITLLYLLRSVPQASTAVVVIRKNIPEFQRRAFQGLAKQYPGLTFEEIESDERIDCARLLIDERETWNPIGNLSGGKDINAIRNLYLKEYQIAEKPLSDYIYISRSRQKQRRTLNENRLIERIKSYGFSVVHPELLSHKEQVNLFHSAKMIIATTGAALTNLLFCQPGCKVIEIRPEDYDYPLFLGLCKQVALDHYYFKGSSIKGKDMFSVNVDALCSLIENSSDHHTNHSKER